MIGKLMPAMAPALSLRNSDTASRSIGLHHALARSISGAVSIHRGSPGNLSANKMATLSKQGQTETARKNQQSAALTKAISPAAMQASTALRAVAIAASARPDASEMPGSGRVVHANIKPMVRMLEKVFARKNAEPHVGKQSDAPAQATAPAWLSSMRQDAQRSISPQAAASNREKTTAANVYREHPLLAQRTDAVDGTMAQLRQRAADDPVRIRSEILMSSRSGWRKSASISESVATAGHSRSYSLDEAVTKLSKMVSVSDSAYGSTEDLSKSTVKNAVDQRAATNRRESQAELALIAQLEQNIVNSEARINKVDGHITDIAKLNRHFDDILKKISALNVEYGGIEKNHHATPASLNAIFNSGATNKRTQLESTLQPTLPPTLPKQSTSDEILMQIEQSEQRLMESMTSIRHIIDNM